MNRHEQQQRRLREFPPEIQALIDTNPAIHRLAHMYACGYICFMDEALAQMVVILARNWHKDLQQAVDLAMMSPTPGMKSAEVVQ